MRRIVFLVGCWLVLLLQDVTAFVSSSSSLSSKAIKGASSPASRPRTVALADGTSPTALHAVAKKKKATTAASKKAKKTGAAKKKAVKKEVITVKKPELVSQMAEQCGLTKRDTEDALNAFL